jgi:hypothetical protein
MSSDLIALRHKLVASGYSPIPLYGKEPPIYGKNNKRKGLAGWQELHNVTPEMIAMWDLQWPDAINTGILCKFTPAIDIDITDPDAATAVENLARDRHEEHGNILVRFGQAPKRAVLLRTDEPFAKITRNLIGPDGSGQKIEFVGGR